MAELPVEPPAAAPRAIPTTPDVALSERDPCGVVALVERFTVDVKLFAAAPFWLPVVVPELCEAEVIILSCADSIPASFVPADFTVNPETPALCEPETLVKSNDKAASRELSAEEAWLNAVAEVCRAVAQLANSAPETLPFAVVACDDEVAALLAEFDGEVAADAMKLVGTELVDVAETPPEVGVAVALSGLCVEASVALGPIDEDEGGAGAVVVEADEAVGTCP